MICSKCGNVIMDGMTFCPKCGQTVSTKSTKEPNMPGVPTMPNAPTMPQAPKMPTAPKMPQAPTAPTQHSGEKGLGTFFRGGMAAVRREERQQQIRQLNEQASRLGMEVIKPEKPEANRQSPASPQQETEQERAINEYNQYAIDGVNVVRGRAIWNIEPGQIARRISERELEEVDKLKGIIVQEGCTAIVFANGELVSTLSSGAYLFYKTMEEEKAALKAAIEKAEKEMQEAERLRLQQRKINEPTFRELGIVGEIGKAFSWVGRIIFGEKKGEAREKVEKRKLDYARILGQLTQAPVLSVYVVSNRYITLTFGGDTNADGGLSFVPFKIPTKVFDIDVAVSLQMRINDIHQFATNYLADSNSATAIQFQRMLQPVVETTVRQQLRNIDYHQEGLSVNLVNTLKEQIKQTINSQVYGISVEQVMQITDNNAEFERFRSVERELYCSERELEYLQRTGEFRNRMASEVNSQQITQATSAEELRYALQKINQDQLLHEDEMAAIADELLHTQIERGTRTEVFRIQHQLVIDDARLNAEWALDDKKTQHDWEREDLVRRRNWGIEDEERERDWIQEEKEYNRDFARQQQRDDYDFQMMMRQRELEKEDHLLARKEQLEDEQLAFDRERQTKFDDDQLDANRNQRQIDKLQAMAEMQAKLDAQKYQNEQNLAGINANRDIEVARANTGAGEREAEFMRQQMEMRDAERNADMDRMERMFGMMGDKMMGMSQNLMGAQQQRANEYREDAIRAQQQQEHITNTAMGVSAAAASNINAFNGGSIPQATPQQAAPQPTPQQVTCECYNCHKTITIAQGTPQCPECGAPFQW